jgi:hypothetical protein
LDDIPILLWRATVPEHVGPAWDRLLLLSAIRRLAPGDLSTLVETERAKVVSADPLNDYQVIVDFSDRTTAVLSVEQLLLHSPNRMDAESDEPGT